MKVPADAWPSIRAIREACGLTRKQVADALGISESQCKQKLLGYKSYLAPGGNYSMKKPGGGNDESQELHGRPEEGS